MKTMGFIGRLLRYQPQYYLLVVWVNIVFYAVRLAFGLILQAFFNALPFSNVTSGYMWSLIGSLIAVALVRMGFQFWRVYASQTWMFSRLLLVHRNLLRRLLELPGARAVNGTSGEILSNLRDDVIILNALYGLIAYNIGLIFFAVIAFVILCRINVTITLLVFLPLLVVIAIGQALRQHLNSYRKDSREATARLTGAIGEIFSAVQAIQVAGAERPVLAHFDTLSEIRRAKMVRDSVLSSTINAIFANTVGIGTGAILLLAAQPTMHLRPGDLAIFISYLSSMGDCVVGIGMLLAQFTQANVSFERLNRLLQGAPATRLTELEPLPLTGPLPETSSITKTAGDQLQQLEISGLTYHHPDSQRGIENINLSVKGGSLTVITGRVGSGKTTLLQAILGLLPKEQGTISWNGSVVDDPDRFFVPPRSAYTAQVPRLFSDTLKANILLGLREEEVDLERAVATAVLDYDVAGFPNGLETLIGTRGLKLSGGQAQRTAAARMLVRDTGLLVFDDLSSALDVETEQRLWERLFSTPNRTYLVVSHRKSVLQRADHIVLLEDGQIADQGTFDELLRRNAGLQAVWTELAAKVV